MSALEGVVSLRSAAAAIARANQRLSRIQTIAALQLEVGPGVCCFCEDPVAGKLNHPPPLHCQRRECVASYHRLYREVRSARLWACGLTADVGRPPKREKNRGRPGPFARLKRE